MSGPCSVCHEWGHNRRRCGTDRPVLVTPPDGTEEWRDVIGYEGIYSVSSRGHVKRIQGMSRAPAGMFIAIQKDATHDYAHVRLTKDGKTSTHRVHHLVAAAFIGPRPEGLFLNHIDCDRLNNSATNLEYVTKRQNEDHAVAHELHPWGERHAMAKLTEQKVREIRAAPVGDAALAARYGVSKSTVQAIRARKTWRRVA